MPRDDRLQVRIGDELMAWLEYRAKRAGTPSADLQARTELLLWRGVLTTELTSVRGFTLAEMRQLADMVGMAAFDAMGVFGALRIAHGGGPWAPEGRLLLQKLAELGSAADFALADALSRFREQELPATAEGFGRVGINVVEE